MRKWAAMVAGIALLAIGGGVAFASWGGGTGDDAASVDGTVTLVDTKYYIAGHLTPLCADATTCNVEEVQDGTWLLDFGAANYYLSNPGSCDLSDFLTHPEHIIDGKLAKHGEIDVYRVDGCDLRSGEEGGSPPWAPGNDSDNDGFEDTIEAFVGTDPVDDCPDDLTDDAWPPDFNDDRISDIEDIARMLPPAFNSALGDPSYEKRKDLVPDNFIDIEDIAQLLPPTFNSTCGP